MPALQPRGIRGGHPQPATQSHRAAFATLLCLLTLVARGAELFPKGAPAGKDHPALHNLLQASGRIFSGGEPVGADAFASLAKLGVTTIVRPAETSRATGTSGSCNGCASPRPPPRNSRRICSA